MNMLSVIVVEPPSGGGTGAVAGGGGDLTLVFALLVFALVFVAGAIITYFVCCARSKQTEMRGLMRVSVTLNTWVDEGHAWKALAIDQDDRDVMIPPALSCGDFLIAMQDPKNIVERRVDPPLGTLAKARTRKYPVNILLERFRNAFELAGFIGEPAHKLLEDLLRNDEFCAELGKLSRKNAKEGLSIQNTRAVTNPDSQNPDRISVYVDIPAYISGAFQKATFCEARNICITLDYQGLN